MKKSAKFYHNPSLPVLLMVGFTVILLGILGIRVYLVDQDMAAVRVGTTQAILAGEAGLHFALVNIQKWLSQEGGAAFLSGATLGSVLPEDSWNGWKRIGTKTDASFRVSEMKKIPLMDRTDTPLFDESELVAVVTEGRAGGNFSRTVGVIGAVDIVKRFAVMNSLNEFYYGQPIQPWASYSRSLESFVKANQELFDERKLTYRGVCKDPKLLTLMFQPGGLDPFKSVDDQPLARNNYGTMFYSCNGNSPCDGPMYCQTPIVVDSHTFFGPVQTASFLYRRGSAQSKIQTGQMTVALPSSRRVQLAIENLEGEMPQGVFVDQDSQPNTSYLPPWKPNFAHLRELAQKSGIYIDANGRGTIRGQETDIDYHAGNHHLFSESYVSPVGRDYQRDEIKEPYVVLSTKAKFEGKNNIDEMNLRGAKLLFSEASVFIRGEIGGDLVVVTPHHIYLTGSTNDEGLFHLFLVAGEGIGLSTVDLENHVANYKPGVAFMEAARQWVVRGALYKPGAGWFGNWGPGTENQPVIIPSDEKVCQRISLTIQGACLEGNLKRWMNHAAAKGIVVKWEPTIVDRLPVVPKTANIIRMKSTLQTF